MKGFLKTLRGYETNITDELSLSTEQSKPFPEGSKLLERKGNMRKNGARRNSIVEINMQSGIADRLFQGDMVLSKKQQNEFIPDIGSRYKRQAYNDKTYPGTRWPNGVTYALDLGLSNDTMANFKIAAELWMNNTCIDFKEDLTEEGK
ncbi:hypothetical protein TELCIR_04355 [Teladorsagia circumcincta]|uniref:Peptidase M12A domain-containing protein n=1 Tax=Teladorsagia circumcincta TaxID=45464 RepID=A0A2G9UVY5_TELCI|nr:hypothetical protein TELCIR_04355 [Teladorsagia circumcincta]